MIQSLKITLKENTNLTPEALRHHFCFSPSSQVQPGHFTLSMTQEVLPQMLSNRISSFNIIHSWKPHITKLSMSCSFMPLCSCVSLVPSYLISLTQQALMHGVHHTSLTRPSALGHVTILLLLVQLLGKCSLTGSLLFGLELQRSSQEMAFSNKNLWNSGEKGCEYWHSDNYFLYCIVITAVTLCRQLWELEDEARRWGE